MTEIVYYNMDLIRMNIVMGRLIKVLTHKKGGILDYFSYYYVLLVQYVP